MIDIAYIPQPRSDIMSQVIDGESVILDKSGGLIHQLNATASFIWQYCDGSNSIEAISDILFENYSVTKEDALSDVSNAVFNFKEKNLLE